ncbi:methylated-DNA--[protein]-cysteine S-methyltransferase [Sporosarcina aquimarina]|nr:methylated-DNA--[protein]-cysteine S-methyltransferase [Sporosarcina aquimarina]MBY0223539.1 methylated-DNA--[protein]-cysteine S-methyltransferase [Sporosarcina aquimarina]
MANRKVVGKMVYWTSFDVEGWNVTMAATERGLLYVGLAEDAEEKMKSWLTKQYGAGEVKENADRLSEYADEVRSYLSGEVQDFTCSVDWSGTPFQNKVWKALQDIPYGQLVTYSDIAEIIGHPSAIRAAASAIGKNPLLLVIPCHRVIAKNGSLSGYRDGQQLKGRLIRMEGNSFTSSS